MSSDKLINYLLRVKRNQIRMMRERGYPELKQDSIYKNMTSTKFKTYTQSLKVSIAENMSGLYTLKIDKMYHGFGSDLYVKYIEWPVDKKTGRIKKDSSSTIKKIIQEVDSKYGSDVRHIMLITLKGLSPNGKILFEGIKEYWFEILTHIELSKVPIDHIFSSEYKALTESEFEKIRVENNMSIDKLPKLDSEDPIARYYGARPGDKFEIKNKNVLPGVMFTSSKYSSIEYRVVF